MSNPLTEYKSISLNPVENVENWDKTEETVTGSRKKLTVIGPDDGKHYIFKYPKDKKGHQIWSELIASFIAGDLLGWDVQHVSIGQFKGHPGNLLKYIYEPGSKKALQEIFIEGWRYCQQVDPEYDEGKGQRHTLPLLLSVYKEVLNPKLGLCEDNFMTFWAKAFALDTLISNSDRHAENWALVISGGEPRMSALYDNGTSMGCQIEQIGLDKAFDEKGKLRSEPLQKFARKGCHHVRLKEPAKDGSPYGDLCAAFLKIFPAGRVYFEQAAEVDISRVAELMTVIQREIPLEEPYSLSFRRQQHICAILQLGVERIRNTLCR